MPCSRPWLGFERMDYLIAGGMASRFADTAVDLVLLVILPSLRARDRCHHPRLGLPLPSASVPTPPRGTGIRLQGQAFLGGQISRVMHGSRTALPYLTIESQSG